jgi:hypothetical protein
MFKKNPQQKAETLEKKGDRLARQNKWLAAYGCYHEAIELDERRHHLYEKLLKTLDEMKEVWTEEHFAHSVHWQMKLKEIEDPAFRRIHARHEPEFHEVIKLIKKMLAAKSTQEETEHVERIVARGTEALYPLIDMLLAFKEAGNK